MKRILTAVVVLPFLIASILISYLWWVFVLLAAAAMVLGLWEFYLLAKKQQLKPDPATGYVAGAASSPNGFATNRDAVRPGRLRYPRASPSPATSISPTTPGGTGRRCSRTTRSSRGSSR